MGQQDDQVSPPQKAAVVATTTVTPGTDDHCATHRREVWAIDGEKKPLRARLDWHRWCPFQDRPKLRWASLVGLVALVLAVVVLAVVFAVYYDALYYSGRAAFLAKQNGDGGAGIPAEAETDVDVAQGALLVSGRDMVAVAAAAGEDVCGEKMDSCEAYNQPNICCPVGMICHATSFSPSGIYCCTPESSCAATAAKPPRCGGRARACDKSLGGGCCAPGTECAAAGCLKTYRAAPGFASSLLSGTQKPPTQTHSDVTVPTATLQGVTVMTPKIGETAQSSDGVRGFGFSSCPKMEMLVLGCGLAVSYAMVLGGWGVT
ncbi:hypothetical protein F4820DRAFT_468148 [Hypoxylon rubiginosum]|uniref:Uncharacterized protein n=1 Tax=Hypoxylon rubiginosum TaxID=110542 RepID=A0ACB9ZGB4_9PEZI|nr:hypothetical protein F4820DRAFT_468148 [Hypoxylon rubiginosum]